MGFPLKGKLAGGNNGAVIVSILPSLPVASESFLYLGREDYWLYTCYVISLDISGVYSFLPGLKVLF